MKLQPNERLVFVGDSITDCGRARPVGEGSAEALGNGYVSIVDALLNSVYPQLSIRVTNVGVSGDTVRDLQHRWEQDVLNLQPDWLSVMIGINDVWRTLKRPSMRETHVLIDEYRRTLSELVQQTRPHVKGLVVMTPYYIEPNLNDEMRKSMDCYRQVATEIAQANQAILVDTQVSFDRALQHKYAAFFALDRVHPNLTGHMVLARAFLDAIRFTWEA